MISLEIFVSGSPENRKIFGVYIAPNVNSRYTANSARLRDGSTDFLL